MAEDQDKQEEKFDFTALGEALGYISLDQAQVLAMETATGTPGKFGRRFRRTAMAFEVVDATEAENYYEVTLSFRPQRYFTGDAGREQYLIEKEGRVAHRQLLSLPRHKLNSLLLPVALVRVIAGVIVVAATVGCSGGGDRPGDSASAVHAPGSTSVQPAGAPAKSLPTNPQPTNTPISARATTPTLVPSPTQIVRTATEMVPKPTTDLSAIANFLSHPWVEGKNSGNPSQPWNARISSMVLSPDHSTIYATALAGESNSDALYRSTDRGRTWVLSATGSPRNGPVRASSLIFDPVDPQIVYGDDGSWRSENGGRSWIRSPNVPIGPFVAYRDVLYAGEFRSTDKGETWQPFPFLAKTHTIPLGNPSVLYSVYQLGGFETYSLKMSTDGLSWKGVRILRVMEGQPSRIVLIIDYSEPPNIYVGTRGNGLFRANALDPKEWSRIAWPPEFDSVRSVAVHPTNPDILAITQNGRIFVTFDGGSSWIELPNPEYMIENVIHQAGAIELVVTGEVAPQVCVGTDVGVWCHDLSLE